MSVVESLEVQIERVWLDLRLVPTALYMTRGGRIVRRDNNRAVPDDWRQIGTFTKAIPLADLRAETFHVFEGMRNG